MDVKSAAALQLSVIGRSETERLSVIGYRFLVISDSEMRDFRDPVADFSVWD